MNTIVMCPHLLFVQAVQLDPEALWDHHHPESEEAINDELGS